MNIYFVRHPHYLNPDNVYVFHLPMELSEEGKVHADRIGKWLTENNIFDIPIYTSQIKRCIQTSEIITKYTHSSISIDKRLIETSCKDLQGTKQPSENAWILEEDNPSREPREHVLERILDFYNEKVRENEDCIVVSHGDQITHLYYYLNCIKLPKYLWGPNNIENIINRGEIVKVELDAEKLHSISRIKVNQSQQSDRCKSINYI